MHFISNALLNKMKDKKKEEYDSLWGDEEEKQEYDPEGKAENADTSVGAPEDLGDLGVISE